MAFVILKSSTGVPENANRCEVLIQSATDLSDPKLEPLAPGSIAHNASMTLMYMKDIDGTWAQIGG